MQKLQDIANRINSIKWPDTNKELQTYVQALKAELHSLGVNNTQINSGIDGCLREIPRLYDKELDHFIGLKSNKQQIFEGLKMMIVAPLNLLSFKLDGKFYLNESGINKEGPANSAENHK